MDSETLKLVAGLVARHAMTVAAGWLATIGLLHSGTDTTNFIQLGSGILVGAAALVWSWWQKDGHQVVVAALKRVTASSTTAKAVSLAQALPVGAANAAK